MPSRYSSDHSITDAEDLVKRQGIHGRTVPIRGMVEAYEAELELTGLAAENLQARVRGNILMGLSNEHGHLVLTTGNKSELATGYSTLYGDSAGGFGPIKDVPKVTVFALCRWRNEQTAGATARTRLRDAADPAEHHRQAAVRGAAAGAARHRLAAAVRGPRRAPRRLRREGHGPRRTDRRRPRQASWSSA